jgi:hypothetical protein
MSAATAVRRPHTRIFDPRTPAMDMLHRRRAWRVGPGCFRVFGRDGLTQYRVLVTPSGETSCTCTAGRFGRACWHQIRALKRVLREGSAA